MSRRRVGVRRALSAFAVWMLRFCLILNLLSFARCGPRREYDRRRSHLFDGTIPYQHGVTGAASMVNESKPIQHAPVLEQRLGRIMVDAMEAARNLGDV